MSETIEQTIRDGERIERFLADEVVARAITALGARYTELWKASQSPSDRESLWAKARALDDLQADLRAVVDAGQRERIVQARTAPVNRNRKG